ncbi:MAG: RNA methyltransferase [Paracoccaceae bacterium]|nr:MAG: RNA methyltransferase [Paracoccaceae bacterium]
MSGAAPVAPQGIFLAAPPGLEPVLAAEAAAAGFAGPRVLPGGVEIAGGWPEVWRANVQLRGAGRVLVRLWSFRAPHLARLDRQLRRLPWGDLFPPATAVCVAASCRRSRIWHEGAAAERLAGALAAAGMVPGRAGVRVMLRIEDDLCTVSLDSSGAPLYRRGFKQAVGRAPLRETMAALFLRACDHVPGEPVVDPMCGAGSFPIEAAEIAAGLPPGRARGFAFEALVGFDPAALARLRAADPAPPGGAIIAADRDGGAIAMARANAERAGIAARIRFIERDVAALEPPEGPPGLVIVNPPYGARIGRAGALHGLHAALGRALIGRFAGWRVGLITAEPALARATGLPFGPPGPPVPHGPLTIRLYRTGPL